MRGDGSLRKAFCSMFQEVTEEMRGEFLHLAVEHLGVMSLLAELKCVGGQVGLVAATKGQGSGDGKGI